MANSLSIVDVYAIVNAAAAQMYGADSTISAIDTTSFVSVGEQMLRTGYESTLDAISQVLARTIVSVRPYKGKYALISNFTETYGVFTRKISFFVKKAEASGNFNTDIAGTQLDDGNTVDHYKISKKYPVEIDVCGTKTLEYSYTTFRSQLKIAFENEAAFAEFIGGMMIAIANDIEHIKEAENMAQVVNYITSIYLGGTPEQKVNLLKEYSDYIGRSVTTEEITTGEYKTAWYSFFVAKMKMLSKQLEYDTELFHQIPIKTDDNGDALTLLRHTPRDKQRVMLYEPMFIHAETEILPQVFNDKYLKPENYEGVMYWQNFNEPQKVSCKPNYLAPNSAGTALVSTSASDAVTLDKVVGVIFDEEALKTKYLLDFVNTTPVNAKGDYFNTFYHWLKQYQQDNTENGVILYIEDYITWLDSLEVAGEAAGEYYVNFYTSFDVDDMTVTAETGVTAEFDSDSSKSWVKITVGEDTEAGEYDVVVTDPTGKETTITVTVAAD